MKRVLFALAVVVIIVVSVLVVLAMRDAGGPAKGALSSVHVDRGSVVRRAIAVGRIVVDYEVPVTSSTGGILTRLLVKLGQKVDRDEPLAEVRPVLTDRSFLDAERALEEAKRGEEAAREFLEGQHLAAGLNRLLLGRKASERNYESAVLGRKRAEEALKLIQDGRVAVDDRKLDFVVRAPVPGHIMEIGLREGATVVPSSSYGSGTNLITLADLDRLIFRGTVDEIDVGRIREGMATTLKVGALPDASVTGKVLEIALKSTERNNATVFEVRVEVERPPSITLRSGYSAVAEIEVDRRDGVLLLPDRVVDFRAGKAFVHVAGPGGARTEREIVAGLGDGLVVEIVSGLAEGDEVLEKVYE